MPTVTDTDTTTEQGPEQRLLDAADRLMYERGYEAVGVADLCAVADVRKGSFYHFFDSKQALALAMLDRAWARARRHLFPPLTDASLGTVDAITEYGERLAAMMRTSTNVDGEPIVAGCRFGNFAVELAPRNADVRARVTEILDEMVELVAAAVRRGVDAGELRADLDVEAVATEIVALMEGLMVLAKARRDPELLAGLGRSARGLLV